MLIPDVNVLVGAYRTDAADHEGRKRWLEDAVRSAEALGLTDAVLTGFVCVVTHPRVFTSPTPLNTAFDQMNALLNAPGVLRVVPGRTFWALFTRLCRDADARGNLIADAAHAATAMEAGATWVTLDRDFARFEGLKWEPPVRR